MSVLLSIIEFVFIINYLRGGWGCQSVASPRIYMRG